MVMETNYEKSPQQEVQMCTCVCVCFLQINENWPVIEYKLTCHLIEQLDETKSIKAFRNNRNIQ